MHNITLPDGFISPKHLCLHHATEMTASIVSYRSIYSLKWAGPYVSANPFLVAFTLVPQLDGSTKAADSFTKSCQYLRELAPKLDLLRYTLRSLEALAVIYKVKIPEGALQYFQELGIDDQQLENVPTTVVTLELPPDKTTEPQSAFDGECGSRKPNHEAEGMRELLARWKELTMNDQSAPSKVGRSSPSTKLPSTRSSPSIKSNAR